MLLIKLFDAEMIPASQVVIRRKMETLSSIGPVEGMVIGF